MPLQENQTAKVGSLNEEELAALDALKGNIVSPPVLALPCSDEHMKLYIDACETQVGCVPL